MDDTIGDLLMVEYRCPCGCTFPVSASTGGSCQQCQRRISTVALQDLLSATVSFIESSTVVPLPSMAEEEDPWIGKRLEHFEILERLGSGGMGSVYRARDCSLERHVAVKLIRTDANAAPAQKKIKALLQEAVAQARVNHPNVVTIYYVNHDAQTPFLAMEIMDGTIAQGSRKQAVAFPVVVDIASQVAQALQASFQLDIVHGDIKPSNLLIDRLGTVKLSDFGLARRVSGEEEERVGLRGTPNYLAPELMRGENPTIYSDMYALGVALFELTFGRTHHVIQGRSVKKWLVERENLVLPFPSSWPEEVPIQWKGVLSRLMAVDPKNRFESYDQFQDAIREIEPHKESLAARLPRLVAWAVDQVAVTCLFLAVNVALLPSTLTRWLMGPWVFLLCAIAYTIGCRFFGRTIGYWAMQLRQVDRSGLEPAKSQWFLRELIRTGVFWAFITLSVGMSVGASGSLAYWATGAVWTVFFVDVVAIVFPGSECLHDRLMKTRVVLRLSRDS